MGRVLFLFGKQHPAEESEPEFDFENELFHLSGHCEDIMNARSPGDVKSLIAKMTEEVENWPDD